MFRVALLFAAPLMLAGCANIVAGPGGTALQEQREREAQMAEEGQEGGLRCRTIRQTGSRLGSRVCRTDEEWEQIERDSQEAHDRLDQGSAQPRQTGGFGSGGR